jgi:phosphoribosyl 1,2-cyclic phosphodiesterase
MRDGMLREGHGTFYESPLSFADKQRRGVGGEVLRMLVCSLGSGSSGNATLIRGASGRTILIDCGVQYPRLCKNLARLGVRPDEIDVVYLSHEHSDHVQAARPLHELLGVPIVTGRELLAEQSWLGEIVADAFDADQPRTVGDITIVPRAVAHDAAGTYGFVVEADGCTAAIFTDLGGSSDTVRDAISGADLTVIEANYDRAMLENGTYPWFLKARIKGRGGHLSNDDCAAMLARAFQGDCPRDVWLAHLSAKNNTPETAVRTVSDALNAAGIVRTRVIALPRYSIGPLWQKIRHQQLTLFGE